MTLEKSKEYNLVSCDFLWVPPKGLLGQSRIVHSLVQSNKEAWDITLFPDHMLRSAQIDDGEGGLKEVRVPPVFGATPPVVLPGIADLSYRIARAAFSYPGIEIVLAKSDVSGAFKLIWMEPEAYESVIAELAIPDLENVFEEVEGWVSAKDWIANLPECVKPFVSDKYELYINDPSTVSSDVLVAIWNTLVFGQEKAPGIWGVFSTAMERTQLTVAPGKSLRGHMWHSCL